MVRWLDLAVGAVARRVFLELVVIETRYTADWT
jgi:hypothetical protein